MGGGLGGGGGASEVLAMLKGMAQKVLGSFNKGAQQVVPCLEGGGGGQKVPDQ